MATKKIKVALVNPEKNDINIVLFEPITLCILASWLEKNGYEVKIIDQLSGRNAKKEITKYNPDFVGISSLTKYINEAYRIADFSREIDIPTVLGGIHPSAMPQEAINHADYVVRGEGEIALLKILKGKLKKGIHTGELVRNIDEIPFLARHLIDMEFYLGQDKRRSISFVGKKSRVASMITSRGCPNKCIFCYNSTRWTPVRFNSAEYVIKEIEHLIDKYNIEGIDFFDDNLLLHKPRLKKICNAIIEKKIDIKWKCASRVDTIDLETLKLIKKAGCRQIGYGFESGSQRILDVLNKGTTVEKGRKALELTAKVGLSAAGSFIIGNPTETEEDVRMTQEFIKNNPLEHISVCVMTPFPGTKVYEMTKNDMPKNPNWDEFITGEYNLRVNKQMKEEDIKKFFQETVTISLDKIKVKPARLIKEFVKNPKRSMSTLIKHPSKIKLFLKSLKNK